MIGNPLRVWSIWAREGLGAELKISSEENPREVKFCVDIFQGINQVSYKFDNFW